MLQDIFKAILVTSFIGTALTLVLALIKPITKRWFTSSWHYYMWLVVLVVMLLPIRISLPGQIQSVPVLESNSQIAEETVSDVTNKPIQVIEQDLQLNSDKEGNTYSRLENLKMFAYDKFNVAAFIWFVSMMVLFLCKLIGYMIFLIKLRKYSDVISCPELMRFTNKKIVTRTSDRISSPLMIGLFKPTLLLPKTEMTPEQLDNVLAHEMTHFKRKDILYKWFISITCYNKLYLNRENVLTPIINLAQEYKSWQSRTNYKLEEIKNRIAQITEQVLIIKKLEAQGCMEPAIYMQKSTELNKEITQLKMEKKYLTGNNECDRLIKHTTSLLRILETAGPIAEFDEGMFKAMVAKLWNSEDEITYELINGTNLKIKKEEV